jgi:hypothetical protein
MPRLPDNHGAKAPRIWPQELELTGPDGGTGCQCWARYPLTGFGAYLDALNDSTVPWYRESHGSMEPLALLQMPGGEIQSIQKSNQHNRNNDGCIIRYRPGSGFQFVDGKD